MEQQVQRHRDIPQQEIHKESLKLAQQKKALGIIPYMEGEIVHLEEEIKAFRAGERPDTVFMPFRLRQGVYGQRQSNVQMIRVKIPGGILTPEALEALGEVAEKYTPLKKGHLTTRENMQYHHVPLENTPEVLRIVGKVGLSTREACGNTVRNVVSCPLAGVCPDEVFDPTPYLAAYVRWAVRNPLTQNFPRKFKTAFSGCVEHDCIAAPIHDLSFIGQVKDGKRGFKILVGGGTSIMARLGKVITEFAPEEDYLRYAQAIWTVFNKADMLRKNRMMARIKVLIDRVGFDVFKKMVDEELKNIGPIDPKPLMDVEEANRETPPSITPANGKDYPVQFLHWRQTNTVVQQQPGYFAVFVKIPLGDIHAHQFNPLADIVRRYTGGRARVTQEQNLALRWVPEAYLYGLWKALKEVDFAEPDANTVNDVVSCPGTDSCKLGITSSMGAARALRQELLSINGQLEDPLVKTMHIKFSGCPNGCGQHHIADIGFQGAAMKGQGGQVPAYEIFLGGQYGGSVETTRYGERIPGVKVPSKRISKLVRHLISYYYENRQQGETFRNFLTRVGIKPFEAIASEYHEVPSLAQDTENLYMDWEKSVAYKVERGEGECSV